MSATLCENLSCLSRRVVGGLGVEEDASADAGGRASARDARPIPGLGERAHLANPSIDLDPHIEDVLNVIKYEDLRDIVLVGHSYGGMVATGVADRARDKVKQLIYVDAFVPDDGQSLLDLNEADRQRMQELAKSGDGWRVPPNPTPPDTSPADVEWLTARRVDMPIKCFETRLQADGRRADAAAKLHLRHPHHAGRYVRAVRANDEERSGLALSRDRRQPFAERHRAGGVDDVTAKDRCLRLQAARQHPNPAYGLHFPPYAQQAGKPVVDVDRGGRVMTARTTAVVETWSTGLVEPERRLDYWIGAVCECFLEMDITTQVRSGFDCSVQRGQLDTHRHQPRAGIGAARLPPQGQRRGAARPTTITCCARPTTTGR